MYVQCWEVNPVTGSRGFTQAGPTGLKVTLTQCFVHFQKACRQFRQNLHVQWGKKCIWPIFLRLYWISSKYILPHCICDLITINGQMLLVVFFFKHTFNISGRLGHIILIIINLNPEADCTQLHLLKYLSNSAS